MSCMILMGRAGRSAFRSIFAILSTENFKGSRSLHPSLEMPSTEVEVISSTLQGEKLFIERCSHNVRSFRWKHLVLMLKCWTTSPNEIANFHVYRRQFRTQPLIILFSTPWKDTHYKLSCPGLICWGHFRFQRAVMKVNCPCMVYE